MKYKFVFKAGLFEPRRKVTVYANSKKDAVGKAKTILDNRAKEYAPVGWDLELIEMTEKKS